MVDMKVSDIKKDLNGLDVKVLRDKIESLRQELFSLKLNASTAHVKDYSEFKKLKCNIARALTYLRQKQQEN